jgi:signal transduction histidine kinase
LAVFLAVYSIGRYGRSRTQSAAAIALAVGFAAVGTQLSGGIGPWFGFLAATIVGLYEVGNAARSHEIRTQELEERDARHVVEREAQAARAADEERGRIARELHDVIAHNVSVMVVQAAAAGRIVDRDPIEARRSLEAIESTGRQALAEMRRLLGVLRRDDEPLLSDPQPSLARLPRLIEEMRASGLPADLSIEGDVRALPAGVDLSAYRVVQEALTNALRHAGESPTRVLLRYGETAIELEVVDGGRAGSDAATIGHGGHGIAGMRERVALVRGELEAGPRPEGGFRIWVRLPIESPAG